MYIWYCFELLKLFMKNFFKFFSVVLLTFYFSIQVSAWGAKGHRIIGEIAQRHLNRDVSKKISQILQGESLAMCSTWMDHIKSDKSFKYMYTWHYCTIPDDKLSYDDCEVPKSGDAIQTIERLIQELSTKKISDGDERMAIRMLTHLIGDIHQPLHVGNGEDRGGNDMKIKWFGSKSNLHRIWDSELIKHQDLSYTEYVNWIEKTVSPSRLNYEKDPVRTWAMESKMIRMSGIYPPEEKTSLGYNYNFKHINTLNQRLKKAGMRLAHVLNEIYKK